jgi:phosphoribosylaminoimidazole-succinocarboxamide synthase
MVDRLAGIDLDGRPLGTAAAGELAERVQEVAIAIYRLGSTVTARAGIILADTKFEFGLLPDGPLLLVDEVLTPDSSRFWDAARYEPGRPQASYDKQYVRDWLETRPWDKAAPGPELPAEIVEGTRRRYVEAFERITGASFDRYLEEDVIAR